VKGIFWKNSKKSLPESKKFAFLSKISHAKVHFLNSSDRLLPFESVDVFIESLAYRNPFVGYGRS